jgi:TonB-dependent SusC/RagA subfamily outer membrane receptor
MYFKANYHQHALIKKSLLIMKITTLLLFLACLTASAGGLAQKVTLSQKNVKLEKVLSEIKKQTGYVFFYDALVLQGAGPVSIYLKDASVEIALKKTLQGLPLDFSIEQKTITIFQKPTIAKPIMADRPFVLLNIINGTVKNEKGEPLLGASVIEKGTNNATTTRLDGSFNIDVANAKVILIISYVGYETKKVTVSNQTTINVTLSLSNSNLNEVVVTGYSSQRKKDIAGAVTVVDVNSAKKITAGTTEQLLQGQAAGVTVINQGAPGAGSYVYIRGITNFKNSQPLYVIDGVQSGSMSDVNPNDIASIQVLKDAGAASIYGVSGGNGVVIITTKKGKQGKTVFSYDGYYGTQVPKGGNVFNKLNPSEMSKLAYAVNDVSTTKALYPDGAGTLPIIF